MITRLEMNKKTINDLKEIAKKEFGVVNFKAKITKEEVIKILEDENTKKLAVQNADKMELGENGNPPANTDTGANAGADANTPNPEGEGQGQPVYNTDDYVDLTDIPTIVVEIAKLEASPFNFFKPLSPKKYIELVDSIKANGVLQDIIVRPSATKDGFYEILAGHNRVTVCKEIGKTTMSAKVVTVNDDKAKEIIVDTNVVQRQELTPMEVAKAYEEKKRILGNRQGQRSDLKAGELTGASRDIIAQAYGVSGMTIDRYLRLNNLKPDLQSKVDAGEIGLKTGVELATMSKEDQEILTSYPKFEEKLSTDKVLKMKRALVSRQKEALKEGKKDAVIRLTASEVKTILEAESTTVSNGNVGGFTYALVVPEGYDAKVVKFLMDDVKDDPAFILNLIKDYLEKDVESNDNGEQKE